MIKSDSEIFASCKVFSYVFFQKCILSFYTLVYFCLKLSFVYAVR